MLSSTNQLSRVVGMRLIVEAGRALQAVMLLSLSCHMHTLKALMHQMMVECGGFQEQFCD